MESPKKGNVLESFQQGGAALVDQTLGQTGKAIALVVQDGLVDGFRRLPQALSSVRHTNPHDHKRAIPHSRLPQAFSLHPVCGLAGRAEFSAWPLAPPLSLTPNAGFPVALNDPHPNSHPNPHPDSITDRIPNPCGVR